MTQASKLGDIRWNLASGISSFQSLKPFNSTRDIAYNMRMDEPFDFGRRNDISILAESGKKKTSKKLTSIPGVLSAKIFQG